MRKILTVILMAITGLIMATNSDFDSDDIFSRKVLTMSYALLRCNDSDFIKLIESKVIANAKKKWIYEKKNSPLSALDSISFVLEKRRYRGDTLNGLNIEMELDIPWNICHFKSLAKVCVLPMGPTGTNYLFVLCDTLPDVFIETDDSITIEAIDYFPFGLDEWGSFILYKHENAWEVKWLKYWIDRCGLDAEAFD